MAKFNKKENIYSSYAVNNDINNYPGIDTDIDPTLTEDFIFNNLNLLNQRCIGPLQDAFGDIGITSAYRCKSLNKALGGVENSQHIKGYAVDLISIGSPSSLLWNWCFQNLPTWNQLIWEYPEKGQFSNSNTNPSWLHISYIEGNNPKITSIATKREDLHELYIGENTYKNGEYTHGITLADENLL